MKVFAWSGTALFFASVGRSIALYPGGNRLDRGAPGYSFFHNFLCDLFAAGAYNGMPNPGRPYAIFGVYALAVALFFFWLLLPRLFEGHFRHAQWVSRMGGLAMVLSLFIATPLHDGCILIASPLGFAALIISIRGLTHAGQKGLARLGTAAVVVCVLNYLSFAFRVFPSTLAGIQKAALIVFLAWMLAVMVRLARLERRVAG